MANKAKKGEALCPRCKQPSSVESVLCPHCGVTYTQAQIDARRQADSETRVELKDDKKNGFIGCAVVVVVILLLATCIGGDEEADSEKASPTVAQTGDPKADAIALFKTVTATAAGCDAASSAMSEIMQRGDLVPAYRAADQAESACLGTGNEIRKLEVPVSITGEHRETVEDALEACDTAYVMKWAGARKLKDIVNGEAKPSDLVELEDTTNQFQRGQMLCVGGLVAAATSLGATSTDLGIEDGK